MIRKSVIDLAIMSSIALSFIGGHYLGYSQRSNEVKQILKSSIMVKKDYTRKQIIMPVQRVVPQPPLLFSA